MQAARAKTSGRSRCKDRHRCINRKSLYTLCVPRISLLGVSLDAITMDEAVSRLLVLLHDDHQHHVVTPNSEMLVAASRDLAFLSVLQSAALALPDSAGLLWMARWTDQVLPDRVAGVDAVRALASKLSMEDTVFLLGAAPGIAEAAGKALVTVNPHISIVGTFSGSPSIHHAPAIIERICAAKPRLLLVAFGAPAQDLWIAQHLSQFPSVRVAMGVGGTFDFLSGKARRAPRLLQSLGLEWFWRVVCEPRRWKRILTAVVVFPLLVLRYGKKSPLLG